MKNKKYWVVKIPKLTLKHLEVTAMCAMSALIGSCVVGAFVLAFGMLVECIFNVKIFPL